jgi:hypothetical protein
MRNIVPLAVVSALQFVFVLAVTWFAWRNGLGNTDMVNTAYTILLGGMSLGSVYMFWKGSGLNAVVMFFSPLISNEIINQNSHWLSPMFPGYLMYGVALLLIWVGIAVVMKVVFTGAQRILS